MPTKGNVTRPRIEPMLMIRPSCCRRMEGSTARVTRSSPTTLVSKIAFACSVVKASVTPAEAIPALLTSTSILPASVSTVLTPASTDASSLTSSSTVSMPSLRRASAASWFLPSAPRIEAYTVWPARRRVCAVSRPKPLLVPVIRIVLDILGLLNRVSCLTQLVADEHDGPVELVDDRLDVGGVVRDPAKRIRRREHRVLVSVEEFEHGPPARRVCECPVNKDNRWFGHENFLHSEGDGGLCRTSGGSG